MSKNYVGDIGTLVLLNTGVNINLATTYNIRVQRPDYTTTIWTATIYATSTLKHVTVAGDLSQKGDYKVQGYIVIPTWQGRGETATFMVTSKFQ